MGCTCFSQNHVGINEEHCFLSVEKGALSYQGAGVPRFVSRLAAHCCVGSSPAGDMYAFMCGWLKQSGLS